MLKPLYFVISALNQPDLLARTVLLFHRLAIPITGLTMRRPEDSPQMRITVQVLADSDQSERIMASLAKLVHVLSVENRIPGQRKIKNGATHFRD